MITVYNACPNGLYQLPPKDKGILQAFSGLFQVLTLESNFSRGKFTQTLNLVRRRNQDLTLEALAGAAVSAFNEVKSMVPGTKKNKLDETPNDEE
jgi:hypothetical protein